MHTQYSEQFLEFITGKLLGDGNIVIQDGRTPRFRFAHTITDREWAVRGYQILQQTIETPPPVFRRVYDKRTDRYYRQYYVQSKSSEGMCNLKELWYRDNKKIVPINFIKNYFSPFCLSTWYQDDGHLKVYKSTPQKVILSTDSFTRRRC